MRLSRTPAPPVNFGYKTTWLAVRTTETDAVAQAIGLQQAEPANWESGVEYSYGDQIDETEYPAFVAPPVNGWTLVHARFAFTTDAEARRTAVEQLLHRLSAHFGEAQCFGSYRVVDYVSWIRAVDGKTVRSFCYADGTAYANGGQMTEEERNIGLPDMSGMTPDAALDAIDAADFYIGDEELPMRIAAGWSVNPQTLDAIENMAPAVGLAGTLDVSPDATRPHTQNTDQEVPFKVFYELYDGTNTVPSDAAKSMHRNTWVPLAHAVARTPNGFIGFIYDSNITLQFYCTPTGEISVNVPVPHRKGSLSLTVDKEGYHDILRDMHAPLKSFLKTLPLTFETW